MGCVRVCRQVEEIEREKRALQRRGRKTFFPCLLASRAKENTQCRSKQHYFGVFLYIQIVNETTSFCTKCIVSFEQNSAKESLISKSVFNFLIY
jgi:hypothetical protein